MRTALLSILLVCGTAGLATAVRSQQPAATTEVREQAYRANNLGVARLEQFDFTGAATSFREALTLAPQLALARLNLGIALFYATDTAGAEREIAAARPNLPGLRQPDYMLGLIARAADQPDAAVAAFERVLQADPADVGTLINLAQLYRQQQRDTDALRLFQQAVAAEPYNATAAYGLAQTLLRTGADAAGESAMTRFEQLRESGFAVTYTQTYLEQGRYAEAIASTGAEPDLVDSPAPDVTFVGADAAIPSAGVQPPQTEASPPGSVTMADLDADGDVDILESRVTGLRVLRNDDARFVDVTSSWLTGLSTAPATAALAGDFDNDLLVDVIVLRPGGVSLLRQTSSQRFADVTVASGLDVAAGRPSSAAWLDADHDGDTDLLLAGEAVSGSSTHLFRNNGNGRFVDVTTAAGLAVDRPMVAVVPTDFDNRRDIDILLIAGTGNPLVLRNMREGSFRDVAADVGLTMSGPVSATAVGDVNKDGFVDVFFARPAGTSTFAMSDGRGRFTLTPAPPAASSTRLAQLVDYDSDGLLDLVAITESGPRLLRNLGRSWSDVSEGVFPAPVASVLSTTSTLTAGDINGDSHVDLVTRGPAGLRVWLNTGNVNRGLKVGLRARVSPRTPVGAKVEMRAGSLWQRHEVYAATPMPAPADVTFGVGRRPGADVLRVLWPSGILQAETAATPMTGTLAIEELDRKPSSCPYLFTWNGERFEFITDFMGGGEMGYWVAPGSRAAPDPDEYVRITGDKLRPREGRYELRVTNELEEALFLDRAQLVVVAHPADIEVHPNEGLGAVTSPFTLHTTHAARPPLAARDDEGRDLLPVLLATDRRYADTFERLPIRGYAAEHTLTLTLPPPGPTGHRRLLLTGWTDYAFSSDNVAAHQADVTLLPPSLEIRDANGTWRTAIASLGVPVGRPQTVVVDLTEPVPASVREVRIRTSMRIYWDQVRVDTSDGRAPHTLTRLEPVVANLQWRGYSAERTPDGREPYAYDYQTVSPDAPWKLLPGRYTREGDVRPLLTATDDMFVVSRTGDEVVLSFDATALPRLPDGWTRTFLFYADGFSKEMNLHSASPDVLAPLPFHAMTAYPYSAPERYPATPAHREYQDRYNTRVVPRSLPMVTDGVSPRR